MVNADNSNKTINGNHTSALIPAVTDNNVQTFISEQPLISDKTGKYVEGEVIVRYKPEIANDKVKYQSVTSTVNEKINPKKIEEIGSKRLNGIQYIKLPSNLSVEEAIKIYSEDPRVLWAQPNNIYRLTTTPNDPYFNQQWGLNNTGQSVNGQPSGTPCADIHASEAWDTFTGPVGSNDVIIAVIDTGIDYTHPDLQDNIWTNPGEMGYDTQGQDKRFNGIDDDGTGIADDWHGWNTLDRNGNITDDIGHGTAMAGIIGASGNNGVGVSGINWKVKIVPVKVFNNAGSATDYWITQGMIRAIDNAGAMIISCSWAGGDSPDHYIKDYIDSHPGVLFIFAAGNCVNDPEGARDPEENCYCSYGRKNNDDLSNVCRAFPASYTSDNIISVASSDQDDNLAYHSHYGATSVDLTAPGTNITSTVPVTSGNLYHAEDGTSPATAMVSGVAGLIKSIDLGASPTTIKDAILQNVDTKSSLTGKVKTGGRLNANRSLSSVAVTVRPIPDFKADVTSGIDPVTVLFTDQSTGARIFSHHWNFGDGSSSYEINPTHIYHQGIYTVSLTVDNNQGNTSTKQNYINVDPAPSTFYIIPSVNYGGTINPSTPINVLLGGNQTFTITANASYMIDTILVNDNQQEVVNYYVMNITVTNVTSNSTISATFKPAIPLANFTATPTSGIIPLTVQFTDTSTNNPTSWVWFFGDEYVTAPWTQVNASPGWSARFGHTSVAMSDGSIVLMGGYVGGGNYKNDVWRSTDNGTTWAQVNASAGWSARESHSSVVMLDGSIVLMGGIDGSSRKNDVWRSTDNGATWTQLTASAPWSVRYGHRCVVMPDGSIVLMGGCGTGNNNNNNDVWRSTDNGATWTQVNASAEWSARRFHSSVEMMDGSIVLMGGYDGSFRNDVWRSANNGTTWTQLTESAEWSARYGHSCEVMPDGSIVLMGGEVTSGEQNDVWRSTDNGATWTQVNASAGWSVRCYSSSVVMPDGSIVLIGGVGIDPTYKNDVWRLIPIGSSAQNPDHTYATAGIYTVSLKATNAYGSNTMTKTNYITVLQRPSIQIITENSDGSLNREVYVSITGGNPVLTPPVNWFNNLGKSTDMGNYGPLFINSDTPVTITLTKTGYPTTTVVQTFNYSSQIQYVEIPMTVLRTPIDIITENSNGSLNSFVDVSITYGNPVLTPPVNLDNSQGKSNDLGNYGPLLIDSSVPLTITLTKAGYPTTTIVQTFNYSSPIQYVEIPMTGTLMKSSTGQTQSADTSKLAVTPPNSTALTMLLKENKNTTKQIVSVQSQKIILASPNNTSINPINQTT
jgi:PKD repeat protein